MIRSSVDLRTDELLFEALGKLATSPVDSFSFSTAIASHEVSV
jgi:hypothetical protein